ncbi:MAG: PHP domain-containing protein, partial [Eubacteriales bacterium]|nr:PHP domain-containing protein [Eubacteriales bacterium]
MIDLHLHTYYSDGTMSPEELVAFAKENGVETIAITDHDGMRGLAEGTEAGERLGVHVIPGIELSTEDDAGIYMHILGYCFDLNNEALNREVELIRRKRAERNEKLLAALHKIGCRISKDDLQLRDGQDYVGKPTFALALMRKGYISSPKEAFKEGRFMRSEVVRSVHREKISAKKAIELI